MVISDFLEEDTSFCCGDCALFRQDFVVYVFKIREHKLVSPLSLRGYVRM